MTKREFLDIVFALAPTEANRIMDAFDEYVDSNEPHWIPVTENCDCDKMDKCEKLQLPPAQPERIKSKWALHTYMPHNKFCMACRNDSPYNKRWDFCPNCGADMRGEQDG